MTYTSGPVPLSSTGDYVTRDFEELMFRHASNREWVLLLGPRQHGKTSALLRIRRQLEAAAFRCAFVDLQTMPPELNFAQLLEWFAHKVASALGHALAQAPQGRQDSLEEWLACAIPMPGTPLVIMIDEASMIRDPVVRNAFYGHIRALKSAGAVAEPNEVSSIVQFIFSGTFRPETLVDELNSPFNVCRRLDTDDLTEDKAVELARSSLGREDLDDVARTIYAEVGGQPHLIQHLLTVAAPHSDPETAKTAVDAEVNRLREQGSDHIDSIFRVVVQDSGLLKIVGELALNGRMHSDPANMDFRFCVVLGLMRRDGAFLVFRNALYESVAKRSAQLRPEDVGVPGIASRFYPIDGHSINFITDSQYQEICVAAYNGAVTAINGRSFRLAVVSFGVALEAILLDFLCRQAPSIPAAIAGTSGQQRPTFNNHEDRNNPETWRLVNLMKVARAMDGVRGRLDIPESLREMRNFVHPVLMRQNYIPEPQLEPEAVGAGALIAMVMRDIKTA